MAIGEINKHEEVEPLVTPEGEADERKEALRLGAELKDKMLDWKATKTQEGEHISRLKADQDWKVSIKPASPSEAGKIILFAGIGGSEHDRFSIDIDFHEGVGPESLNNLEMLKQRGHTIENDLGHDYYKQKKDNINASNIEATEPDAAIRIQQALEAILTQAKEIVIESSSYRREKI